MKHKITENIINSFDIICKIIDGSNHNESIKKLKKERFCNLLSDQYFEICGDIGCMFCPFNKR